jgi:thioesterase-3
MLFETNFKIRSYHTDGFGHVNNARHLELLEEARWRFAEEIGLVKLLRQQQLGFIIIDMRIRFRLPVVEGDTIRIETSLVTLGSASGDVQQLVRKVDSPRIAVWSTFHFILIDRNNGQSIAIEGSIREALLEILEKKPIVVASQH